MKNLLSILSFLFFSLNSMFAQLSVDTGSVTPSGLLTAITAGGIAVSNISYNGDPHAASTFSCTGSCNLGISGGIILTTGLATIAADSNSASGQGYNLNLGGDSDLDVLTGGGTLDACILEFDFIATSDTAVFNYIFASEEYSEYVNSSYNDVFGFFISGPGITGKQNIALVPGTSVPIAINNVNNGNSLGIPAGPCNNCVYFHDNVIDTFTTAYDGLTTILTATAANIQPGQTYHLKLAVADVADHIYDTGVFLEAGSFRSAGPAAMYAGGNRIISDTVHICQGGSVSLSAPSGFSYLWNTGESTQGITVSSTGAYSVVITGTNSAFTITSPVINFIVDNTTIPVPVLTIANNIISSSVTSSNYYYSWTFNGMPVANADSSSLPALQSGCYAVTVQETGGCFITSDTLCTTILGIKQFDHPDKSSIFPNPLHQSSTLTFENQKKKNYTFVIIDLEGKEHRRIDNITSGNILIEKGDLNRGIYFYELLDNAGIVIYKGKIVID